MNPPFAAPLILLMCRYLYGCADVQERTHIVGARTGTALTEAVGKTITILEADSSTLRYVLSE
jgi:hypothetical protein